MFSRQRRAVLIQTRPRLLIRKVEEAGFIVGCNVALLLVTVRWIHGVWQKVESETVSMGKK